jgi:thiol-disulfide isomerase/thioredoxin
MKFLMIAMAAMLVYAPLLAQPKKPVLVNNALVKKTVLKGRLIPITLNPLKNTTVYLGSYFGKGMALVDSAKLNEEGKGVFKGDTKLTTGIYFVVSPNYTIQFEFLMDGLQHFSIVADTAAKDKAEIIGSPDNDLFKAYAVFSATKGKQLQELEQAYKKAPNAVDSNRLRIEISKVEKELGDYKSAIQKKHPASLLSALFHIMKRPIAPAIPIVNGKADSLYPYRFVKNHFWDDVIFSEDRLLRTPFFEPKPDDYFKYYISPEPDSIIAEVKYMLLSARSAKALYPYLLTKFTNKYMNPEFMGQDKVFIYLFENFYAKGDTVLLNPTSRKTIIERAYSLMANQLGQPAPMLELTDTLGKIRSLYGIDAPFTVVAFWDPNCGHCKDEIPRLDSLYRSKWKAKGVVVYSVNIYENEFNAWKQFIVDKKLSQQWIHAYQTKEAKLAEEKSALPNYRQLYDIFKTPTIYLLDKNKRILAKQLSLEQFDALMEAQEKR